MLAHSDTSHVKSKVDHFSRVLNIFSQALGISVIVELFLMKIFLDNTKCHMYQSNSMYPTDHNITMLAIQNHKEIKI